MINLSSVTLLETLPESSVAEKANHIITVLHQYTNYPIIERIEFQDDVTQNDINTLIEKAKHSHEERNEMMKLEQIDIVSIRLFGLLLWEVISIPLKIGFYITLLNFPEFMNNESEITTIQSTTNQLNQLNQFNLAKNWSFFVFCVLILGFWFLSILIYIIQVFITRKSAFPLNYYLNHLAVNRWYWSSRVFLHFISGKQWSDTEKKFLSLNNRSIKIQLNELLLHHEVNSTHFTNRLLWDNASKFELHSIGILTICSCISVLYFFELFRHIQYFHSYMAILFSFSILASYLIVSFGNRMEQLDTSLKVCITTILLYGNCIIFTLLLALKFENQIPEFSWSLIFLPFSALCVLVIIIVCSYAITNFHQLSTKVSIFLRDDQKKSNPIHRRNIQDVNPTQSLLLRLASHVFVSRLVLSLSSILLFQVSLFHFIDTSRAVILLPLMFSEIPFIFIFIFIIFLVCSLCIGDFNLLNIFKNDQKEVKRHLKV